MLTLIRASFYKMFHDRAFLLCMIGTVLWTFLVEAAQVFTMDARGIADISQLANKWNTFSGLHAIEVPLIFIAIILFSAEYKDKSWKLLIAKGISKTGYFISKLLCILVLTLIISMITILTNAVGNVIFFHAPLSSTYIVYVLKFLCGQYLAHASIAVLILFVIFVTRSGEIASGLCMTMMIFSYVILSKLEAALNIPDQLLVRCCPFCQTAEMEFGGYTNWLQISLVFAGYLIFCTLAVVLVFGRRDVE